MIHQHCQIKVFVHQSDNSRCTGAKYPSVPIDGYPETRITDHIVDQLTK
jgi:hypothetical protein